MASLQQIARRCSTLLFAALTVAAYAAAPGPIQVTGSGTPPKLFFACCDQGAADMQSWISNPKIIAQLKDMHAELAFSISDFSPARTQAIEQLNQDGIPLVAWLMLPADQGGYMNAQDAPEAARRFVQFQAWTQQNHLRWVGVGLDIEPNFRQLQAEAKHKLRFRWLMIQRFFNYGQVQQARDAYTALIRQIHAAGYPVQTYQMAFLADERAVHSTLLERLFGIVDVRGDEEVLMAYGSLDHAAGAGLVWNYGPAAQVLAVGSTLADKNAGPGNGPLNWQELSNDLVVASHFTATVGIYSLEGCIRQGFLPQLATLDWGQTVTIPASAMKVTAQLHKRVRIAIWILSRLPYFLIAVILLAIYGIFRLMQRRRRKKRLAQIAQGGRIA